MKRDLLFVFVAMACMFMACSEKSENKKPSEETPVVELYSAVDLWGGEGTGASDVYFMHMAYNIPNDTIFKKRVDASFEMFKGENLEFQAGADIDYQFNSPVITNDKDEKYFDGLFSLEHEWDPDYYPGNIHDYHRQLDAIIPEEGNYEFRLKLYQAENDRTFYSSKYRLNVVKKHVNDPGATHKYYYYGNLEKIQ